MINSLVLKSSSPEWLSLQNPFIFKPKDILRSSKYVINKRIRKLFFSGLENTHFLLNEDSELIF